MSHFEHTALSLLQTRRVLRFCAQEARELQAKINADTGGLGRQLSSFQERLREATGLDMSLMRFFDGLANHLQAYGPLTDWLTHEPPAVLEPDWFDLEQDSRVGVSHLLTPIKGALRDAPWGRLQWCFDLLADGIETVQLIAMGQEAGALPLGLVVHRKGKGDDGHYSYLVATHDERLLAEGADLRTTLHDAAQTARFDKEPHNLTPEEFVVSVPLLRVDLVSFGGTQHIGVRGRHDLKVLRDFLYRQYFKMVTTESLPDDPYRAILSPEQEQAGNQWIIQRVKELNERVVNAGPTLAGGPRAGYLFVAPDEALDPGMDDGQVLLACHRGLVLLALREGTAVDPEVLAQTRGIPPELLEQNRQSLASKGISYDRPRG